VGRSSGLFSPYRVNDICLYEKDERLKVKANATMHLLPSPHPNYDRLKLGREGDTDKVLIRRFNKIVRWNFSNKHVLDPASGCKRLIFFCNPMFNHWFIVVANLEKKTMFIVDSYHNVYKLLHKCFVASCFSFLKIAAERMGPQFLQTFLGGEQSTWRFSTEHIGNAKQNGCDCGIFSLANAESICRGELPTFTGRDIEESRGRVFSAIAHERFVTLLGEKKAIVREGHALKAKKQSPRKLVS